jgi:hypothetical protein
MPSGKSLRRRFDARGKSGVGPAIQGDARQNGQENLLLFTVHRTSLAWATGRIKPLMRLFKQKQIIDKYVYFQATRQRARMRCSKLLIVLSPPMFPGPKNGSRTVFLATKM